MDSSAIVERFKFLLHKKNKKKKNDALARILLIRFARGPRSWKSPSFIRGRVKTSLLLFSRARTARNLVLLVFVVGNLLLKNLTAHPRGGGGGRELASAFHLHIKTHFSPLSNTRINYTRTNTRHREKYT